MSTSINYREAVLSNLDELGIKLETVLVFEWLDKNKTTLKTDDVINRIYLHRNKHEQQQISKDTINTVLTTVENELKSDFQAAFIEKIKYEPSPTDKFEELCQLICQEEYDPMYPIIFRHMVWTIKRRLAKLPDYCPIFVSLYGPKGCGKSEFLKAFFSILPSSLKSRAANASDLFNDDRHAFRFVENAVIVMDELSGISKTDINKLKNQLDVDKIVYRMLGYNRTAEGRNLAQLIGSSNTRLRNTITTDTDIRKWAEIDFHGYPDNEVPSKMVIPLQQFDWLTLWKSVDENSDSPFHDPKMYNRFGKWTQAKCQNESSHMMYIEQIMDTKAGQWLSKKELYDFGYCQEVTEYRLNWGPFKEKCEKMGFKVHKREKGIGLLVPAKVPITTEEDF